MDAEVAAGLLLLLLTAVALIVYLLAWRLDRVRIERLRKESEAIKARMQDSVDRMNELNEEAEQLIERAEQVLRERGEG